MLVSAQIKFTQGSTTDDAGISVIGVADEEVVVSNGNNDGISFWEWTLLDAPPTSTLDIGVFATGSAAQTAAFTPDVTGCYRVQLFVRAQDGKTSTQVRNFAVPNDRGWIIPSFQSGKDELNFGGDTRGWAGLLTDILNDINTGGSSLGTAGGQLSGSYPNPTVNHGTSSDTACAGDDARLSDDRAASGLRTATTIVSIAGSAAPDAGQVLTAIDDNAAAWTDPPDVGTATGLQSATTIVAIDSATAPTAGQVLTAIDDVSAEWVTPSSALLPSTYRPEDFGGAADGDGSGGGTDNAAAIESAILAAGARIGGRVLFSLGEYFCSRPVNVNAHCTLEGVTGGAGIYYSPTVIRFAAGKCGFIVRGTSDSPAGHDGGYGTFIRGLQIVSNGRNMTTETGSYTGDIVDTVLTQTATTTNGSRAVTISGSMAPFYIGQNIEIAGAINVGVPVAWYVIADISGQVLTMAYPMNASLSGCAITSHHIEVTLNSPTATFAAGDRISVPGAGNIQVAVRGGQMKASIGTAPDWEQGIRVEVGTRCKPVTGNAGNYTYVCVAPGYNTTQPATWNQSAQGISSDVGFGLFASTVLWQRISAWQAAATVYVGTIITPTSGNAGGYSYVCVTAGTNGGTQPASWNQALAGQTTDSNGPVWQRTVLANTGWLLNSPDGVPLAWRNYGGYGYPGSHILLSMPGGGAHGYPSLPVEIVSATLNTFEMASAPLGTALNTTMQFCYEKNTRVLYIDPTGTKLHIDSWTTGSSTFDLSPTQPVDVQVGHANVGIDLEGSANIYDCIVGCDINGAGGFTGSAIAIQAGHSSFVPGRNANLFLISNVYVMNSRHGVFCEGEDAQAGYCDGVHASQNRDWAFCDFSQQGNTFLSPTVDGGLGYISATATCMMIFGAYTEGSNTNAVGLNTHYTGSSGNLNQGGETQVGATRSRIALGSIVYDHIGMIFDPSLGDFYRFYNYQHSAGATHFFGKPSDASSLAPGFFIEGHGNGVGSARADINNLVSWTEDTRWFPRGFKIGDSSGHFLDPTSDVVRRFEAQKAWPTHGRVLYPPGCGHATNFDAGDTIIDTVTTGGYTMSRVVGTSGPTARDWFVGGIYVAGEKVRPTVDHACGFLYVNNTGVSITAGSSEPNFDGSTTVTGDSGNWTKSTATGAIVPAGAVGGYLTYVVFSGTQHLYDGDLAFVTDAVKFTGSPGGTLSLQLPLGRYSRWYHNATTGGFDITVIAEGATGTSVTIPNGFACRVECTGYGFVRASENVYVGDEGVAHTAEPKLNWAGKVISREGSDTTTNNTPKVIAAATQTVPNNTTVEVTFVITADGATDSQTFVRKKSYRARSGALTALTYTNSPDNEAKGGSPPAWVAAAAANGLDVELTVTGTAENVRWTVVSQMQIGVVY